MSNLHLHPIMSLIKLAYGLKAKSTPPYKILSKLDIPCEDVIFFNLQDGCPRHLGLSKYQTFTSQSDWKGNAHYIINEYYYYYHHTKFHQNWSWIQLLQLTVFKTAVNLHLAFFKFNF